MSSRRPPHLPLSPRAVELVAARFRILGEPLRIRLLQALREGERSVGELVAAVDSTQPNVSKHLRILQAAGLVARRQEGNSAYYSIADPGVFALCDLVCDSVGSRLARGAELAAELRRAPRAR
jgi:DNA-binding transcriptional ArsR family regulator